MRRSVILTKAPFAPYYEDRYFAGLSATQRVPLWTRSPWFAKKFDLGDTLTLQAWVNHLECRHGVPVFLVVLNHSVSARDSRPIVPGRLAS